MNAEEPMSTADRAMPADVKDALYAMQDAIFRHPMLAQSVFSSLVEEGRRYAETEEGAALRKRLTASRSAAAARFVWELATANSFEERPAGVLPSAFLERLVRAIAFDGIEPLLSRAFERRLR